MRWLQQSNSTGTLQELQLDIVGFLAILGEGSILANAQVSTLSKWVFLPRLLPAPQALLRPSRPSKLQSSPGWVTGVFSGNATHSINHIGNIVCDADKMKPFSVRVVEITRESESPLKAKTLAPLTVVLFLGAFFSAVLLALSIQQGDGMSLIATILLSLLSSIIGWGNKWTLQLPQRKIKTSKVPRGDVVIRYPKGSFLIVKCEEEVARELYFAPEEIHYLLDHAPVYRLLSLVGTIMLMGGVIALANAKIELQIAWAGSYMLLGSSYWIVAALPAKLHWDTSCYKVKEQCFSDSRTDLKGYPSLNDTFTQALWKAIVVTKGIKWVRQSDAAPDTQAWQLWLNEALYVATPVKFAKEQRIKGVTTWEVPEWNAQLQLAHHMANQAADEDQEEATGKKLEEV